MTIQDAIDAFLAHMQIGYSQQTISTYGAALSAFTTYLRDAGDVEAEADQLDVDAAIDFVSWLADTHFAGRLAKSSLRTYLSAMSQFYTWLAREGYITISVAQHERMKAAYASFRRGGRSRLPKPASDDIVDRLVAAAREQPAGDTDRLELCRLRNIAIVEALRATGMRVGELVGLQREDLYEQERTARVIGKGDKERVVYFDRAAWRATSIYLDHRGDTSRFGGRRTRNVQRLPVFSRHDRAAGSKVLPITTNTVRDVFEQLARAAGIEEPVTPHSLRHAFATKALERTEDLAVVQDLLGHADPKTTRVYAKVRSRRLKEAHQQIFPEGDYEDV